MTEHLLAHYYKISSADRQSNETSGKFTIAAPNFDDTHSFRVEELVLPFTWYPINSNNNVLAFNPNGAGNTTVTITPGSYTSSTFITELQTRMNAAGGGQTYTATISASTGLITITANAANFTILRATSTIWPIMGLNQSLGTSVAANSFVSDFVINLTGTNVVVVKSRELCKYSTKVITSINGSQDDIICRIPVTGSFGSTILFKPYNKYLTYNGKRGTQIDLALFDQYGFALNMNGGDWFISLKFHTGRLHNIELRHDVFTGGNSFGVDDFTANTYSNKN